MTYFEEERKTFPDVGLLERHLESRAGALGLLEFRRGRRRRVDGLCGPPLRELELRFRDLEAPGSLISRICSNVLRSVLGCIDADRRPLVESESPPPKQILQSLR